MLLPYITTIYLDGILRASKGKQDIVAGDDIEDTLEQSMVLFRHLRAKDVV